MSDNEPRRSVRSTKGQHKSLDQLDQPASDMKKQGRRGRKKADDRQDDADEEVIRCVCGATEQDGDPNEPWIACDQCTAWQHNVCMDMSVYSEDLPKDYYCEQCKPENHKELLEGIARGEKPWEERRRLYEEEKASGKRRKGGRRAKPKRNSDAKDSGSAKPSPTPEAPGREPKGPAGVKRKSRADSEDLNGKFQRRRLSGSVDVPDYTPPKDLPEHIAELVSTRQPPAKGLSRAITEVLGALQKKKEFTPEEGSSVEATAERLAIQIEHAVHEAHPVHKEYAQQIRSLLFNLKSNHDLTARLLQGTLNPPMLATMTSDELASRELQQKTAKMRAQAERQSILVGTDDTAPRVRRTHKGEELVERDSATVVSEDKPSVLRRQATREPRDSKSATPGDVQRQQQRSVSGSSRGGENLQLDTGRDGGPRRSSDFDLKRVFSSVRSPTSAGAPARRSIPMQYNNGAGDAGEDADVDRLLQDSADDREESPPYSPTEEASDPGTVWRGVVTMNTVANFAATARHVGGVNLQATIGLPWTTLVPRKLTVAGRINEQTATEYLCSLRYSPPTDITIASLSPASDAAKADFLTLMDYFIQRKRYGVVAEKGVENVRDTYLVPIPAGSGSHPEFMLNLEDNFVPATRAAPMLLLVIVYRNDAAAMEKLRGPYWTGQIPSPQQQAAPETQSAATAATPTGAGAGLRTASLSAPGLAASSPLSPSIPNAPAAAATPGPLPAVPAPAPAHTPIRAPVPPAPVPVAPLQPLQPLQPTPPPAGVPIAPSPAAGSLQQQQQQQQQQHHVAGPAATAVAATADQQRKRDKEILAREILGPLVSCASAVQLINLDVALDRPAWESVRDVLQRLPQTRDDVNLLGKELARNIQQAPAPAPTPSPAPAPAPTGGPALAPSTPQTPVPIPRVPTSTPAAVAPRPAP